MFAPARTWLRLLLACIALIAVGAPVAVAQSEAIDIEVFYRELEPFGRWIDHPRYGAVWVPDVEDDWRPYSRGRWVDTEEHGWYWESDEPFAWAVYHYGRWFLDDDEGWVWVPGTEWGPAWVAWRHGDDDVGWAALPPEAEWRDGEIVIATGFYDSPRFSPAWCFVPIALFTAPRIWSHIHAPRRNAYYLGRTRYLPWRSGGQSRIYNAGIDRRRWESLTGRRIETRRIVAVDQPVRSGSRIGRSGDIGVYRPRIVAVPRDDGRPGFRLPASRPVPNVAPPPTVRRFPEPSPSQPDRRSIEPRTLQQRNVPSRAPAEPFRDKQVPLVAPQPRRFEQPKSREAPPSELRRLNRENSVRQPSRAPEVRQFPQHQPAPRRISPPQPPPARSSPPPPPPQQRAAPPQAQQGHAVRKPPPQRGQPGQPPAER